MSSFWAPRSFRDDHIQTQLTSEHAAKFGGFKYGVRGKEEKELKQNITAFRAYAWAAIKINYTKKNRPALEIRETAPYSIEY